MSSSESGGMDRATDGSLIVEGKDFAHADEISWYFLFKIMRIICYRKIMLLFMLIE